MDVRGVFLCACFVGVGTVGRMVRRGVAAVLADCVSDRLEMAGACLQPMFHPATTLRFCSGARVQLDGVPPDQLAVLQSRVAEGGVTLKSSDHRKVTFQTLSGDCSCAAQLMSVVWDPWAPAA